MPKPVSNDEKMPTTFILIEEALCTVVPYLGALDSWICIKMLK